MVSFGGQLYYFIINHFCYCNEFVYIHSIIVDVLFFLRSL